MKPKILVVEDEMIIAYDIKGILENDYDVIINVKSVDEAILKIEEEQPNLVLLDINLRTEKDGTSIGEYLLKKDSIPFVYITSYCDKTTLDRVKDTRPYGYIVKPFKSADLLSTVFLALNTFKHRKVDLMRSEKEIIDDIPYRIKETINYINEHLCEKIEVNVLAKITNWKPHHFIRVFTKFMGVTPYQYILIRKIEKSKVLLLDESISITSIAFELGFQSYSNYINAFKKITNTTPEMFRNIEKLNNKYSKKN
jgi:AraC-like DNA-binding protein